MKTIAADPTASMTSKKEAGKVIRNVPTDKCSASNKEPEAAPDENADACGEEERNKREQIPAEVGEGMGEGSGEGAIDVEKDEEGATAEAGEKPGEADEKSAKKLEHELHGGGGG